MSLSPFGEPPPGTDLSADHGLRNNTAVITTFVLATIAVGLRFYTRYQIQSVRIAADDWMIVGAFVSCHKNLICRLLAVTTSLILTVVGGYHGLGKHVWVVPIPEVVEMMRTLFVYVLLYIVTVPLIKLSIILFYRRIFGMTYTMWFCVFLTAGYFISCLVAFLVCCRPVSYYWTQYAEPNGGRCIYDLYPFYIGNAAANVVTDGIILLVPIPLVWKLQMRKTQKFMVSGIFLLGGFVCIASIIRIYYMTFLKTSPDVTWIMGDVFIWSSVEPSIGIVCACLPTLHPLLRSFVARVFGSSTGRYAEPSSNQESAKKNIFVRRPMPLDWDESLLSTRDVHVEMSGLRRDRGDDGKITVDTDFRMAEESNHSK
ncbi:hypothetical protein N7517_006135 [Penicillium concentricum]|uniref:Rhodopsin domain-containing protein n=1 Tax=Penicillium concentricum TaxID=293559 RepID=A0A9W9SAU2_9EURO|nr:uncharacterized protein N7517_006135 [Penicillium concentricum]KAJ5374129.1 hypothetical protein N7517_006135 [Penicillium concentricum]